MKKVQVIIDQVCINKSNETYIKNYLKACSIRLSKKSDSSLQNHYLEWKSAEKSCLPIGPGYPYFYDKFKNCCFFNFLFP